MLSGLDQDAAAFRERLRYIRQFATPQQLEQELRIAFRVLEGFPYAHAMLGYGLTTSLIQRIEEEDL